MTLEAAIKRYEEEAEQYNEYGIETECYELARDLKQIANWLKELKELKEKRVSNEFIEYLDNIHNSATEIEQLAKALKIIPANETYADEIIDNIITIRANVSCILNPPLEKKNN